MIVQNDLYQSQGRFINIISTLFLLLSSLNIQAVDRITGEHFSTRSPVLATEAMAATSQPLATQVALEIMRKGGNAMDAAIAGAVLLGIC